MARQIAIAVVEHEGRFLIGQRPAGTDLAGYWEFPGGKIEPGETAEQAAVRECREETGLAVEPSGVYPRHIESYAHGTVELHFVACRLAEDISRAGGGRFQWVERRALADYTFPAGNQELLRLLTGSDPASC